MGGFESVVTPDTCHCLICGSPNVVMHHLMWENANNDYFRQLNYARFCMIKNQRKEKTSGSDFNV